MTLCMFEAIVHANSQYNIATSPMAHSTLQYRPEKGMEILPSVITIWEHHRGSWIEVLHYKYIMIWLALRNPRSRFVYRRDSLVARHLFMWIPVFHAQ